MREIIFNTSVEQKSDLWHLEKIGKFSGSEIHKLMGAKGLGKTGETYILKKFSEWLTGTFDEVDSEAIRWGIEHEPVAAKLISDAKGIELSEIGFITNSDFPNCVVSPDRIAFANVLNADTFGIEIKCPMTLHNHARFIRLLNPKITDKGACLKEIEPDYYYQAQMCMLISDIYTWNFYSYNPFFTRIKDLRLIEAVIHFNQKDADIMADRIKEANEILEELKRPILESL